MVQDDTKDSANVQQLKLELAGYQSCCKQLGEELADRDRELEGQSQPYQIRHRAFHRVVPRPAVTVPSCIGPSPAEW